MTKMPPLDLGEGVEWVDPWWEEVCEVKGEQRDACAYQPGPVVDASVAGRG